MASEILHSGVAHDENPPGRGSGRYAWGSGENPGQHQFSFLSEVQKLKDRGLTEAEIAKMLIGQKGVNHETGEPIWATSTDLRARISIEKNNERKVLRATALKLYDECHGNVSEVARRLGKNESSVRSLLKDSLAERQDRYQNTADLLRARIDEVGMIDISKGVELSLGVTDYTKKVAATILQEEGYVKTWVQVPQASGDNKTTITVLARKPNEGETEKDVRSWVQKNKGNLKSIKDFTPDQGKTWWTPEFPAMLDSSRIMIRYAEDGGKDKDGVIELRRGVEDISLGNSQYAQVRIGVDGTHYLKGMAMYADDADFPSNDVDVIFNTNKHRGTPALGSEDNTVLKLLKRDKVTGEVDRDNPFGALIKNPKEQDGIILAGGQRHYVDKDGKTKLSPINKVRDEGDWDGWDRNLSAQFLSKQPMKLINQQLNLSVSDKKAELDEIMQLTNPVIKKKLLEGYADKCDALSSELTARGFKGQAFQVLLPIPSMPENEVYAPNYKNGDTVALIRYPHAGIFEIPTLTVNNNNPAAKRVMEGAHDAIGINPKVAERLSGADFDGDTALVIPMKSNRLAISTREPLPELKNFDPADLYSLPGISTMTNDTKQRLMGEVSNLITDMTIGGASWAEIGRAVRHSMVVIDAQKHNYDYKQSALDNDILALKKTYQGVNSRGGAAGASTILSKAGSEAHVNQRKEVTDTKKMTSEELAIYNEGGRVYHETGKTKMKLVTDPKKMTPEELERYNAGKKVYRESNELVTQKTTKMAIASDAMELVHDPTNLKEVAYANYANTLRSLANQARKAMREITPTPVNKESQRVYANEVASLKEKLRIAEMNAPRERQALVIMNSIVSEKFASNPDMDYEHRQRERARALLQARAMVGAKKTPIQITDSEWEAIQADALSTATLTAILNNTDQDKFKQRATPRKKATLSPAEMDLARSMAASGMYTQAEIAERLRVSPSTISKFLRGV